MPTPHSPARSVFVRLTTTALAELALCAVILAGAVTPAQAMVFPFASGFSPSVNGSPNNWSYLVRTPPSGPDVPLTSSNVVFSIWKNTYLGTPGTTLGWNSPSMPSNVPIFFAHNNLVPWWVNGNCCGPVTLPIRSVIMHPGASGFNAVLGFVVPSNVDGTTFTKARIKGKFIHIDCQGVPYGANGIIWSIEHNGVLVPGATGSLNSTNCSSLASSNLAFGFPVATGDTINFVVDANNGNYLFDSTALSGQIQLN